MSSKKNHATSLFGWTAQVFALVLVWLAASVLLVGTVAVWSFRLGDKTTTGWAVLSIVLYAIGFVLWRLMRSTRK